MFDKGSRLSQTLTAILVCELFEVICSVVNVPDWIYRLLAIRYLFLIFLAWIWVKDGIRMTKMNWILSILSALSIVYFEYLAIDSEPLFFNTAWSFHRWPCYFYVAFLLTYLLYQLYTIVRNSTLIDKFVKMLAKCSYEIFLVQMAACLFVPSIINLSNRYLNFGLTVSSIFIISILGGYLFNILYNKFLSRIKVMM